MLCPASVSAAAAAAVWLLAVLGPVLSLPAEHNSEADFSLCSHCFYRQTPPKGASAGPLLSPLCHRLPGGQTFATLSKPTCDTAVYSAFHLSPGEAEREGEVEGELVEEDENTKVITPALLKGGVDPSDAASLTDSPLQHWDLTVTTLVQSSFIPQCSAVGGELYILTGAGSLRATKDREEECLTLPLWSAVCCAVPEGNSGFSVGLIKETEEGERQVSVKALEAILGVEELFSEGCRGSDGGILGIIAGLFSATASQNIVKVDADLTDENTGAEDLESNAAGQITEEGEGASDTNGYDTNKDTDESREAQTAEEEEINSDTTSQVSNEDVQEIREAQTAEEEEINSDTTSWVSNEDVQEIREAQTAGEKEVSSDTASQVLNENVEGSRDTQTAEDHVTAVVGQQEEDDSADVTQDTSPEAEASESGDEKRDADTHKRSVRTESFESSQSSESPAIDETVDEQETDTNSSSTVVYILSTTLSIIKAPLRPVFSTITQLPGQVLYVLQEDLGVLSTLPGDTFSFFHLLTSDLLSWLGSAGDMLLGIGETCFCSTYYCTSSMLGALYNSCHTGVTGMGTLAGDTVGVFGGVLDKTWWVTKFFGGRLWEHSEGYVGTVVSEMGGQAQALGGGVGKLAWNSGNGMGRVFRMGWRFLKGIVGMIIGAIRGAFGEESE